ncbi:MAG TPA: nucleoside triphosphate pyrophosphatase, partial [Beutenbergiaceae bacterium]|nr:nucleoside triphosphate pyrophosphatase [Beutenbergiaceae bacterium]
MVSLVLASASPARAATLRAAGLSPTIHVADLDEHDVLRQAAPSGGLTVAESVMMLAQAKAHAVATAHPEAGDVVVGCDSMLEFQGQGYGKPSSPQEAHDRWLRMRGSAGVLHTGHYAITPHGQHARGLARATVHFADISDAEVEAYIASGEPLNVAGGFTIDGLGGPFITKIEGDHHA